MKRYAILWGLLLLSLPLSFSSDEERSFPIVEEVIVPLLERHFGEGAMTLSSSLDALDLEREINSAAFMASQLPPGKFNQEVLLPLQHLYMEERILRVGVLQLMGAMEVQVKEELTENQAQSWYGSVIDKTTALAGSYVLAHTLGTAIVKTKVGNRYFNKIKDRVEANKNKSVPVSSDQSCLVTIGRLMVKYDGSGAKRRVAQNWLTNILGKYETFTLGIASGAGLGLLWGGGEALHHELSVQRFSPLDVISSANRYLMIQNSYATCAALQGVKKFRENFSGEQREALLQWKSDLQEMREDMESLQALAPELREGVPIAPAELQLQDFWELGTENCRLEPVGDSIVLGTNPSLYALIEAEKVLAPLFESYLGPEEVFPGSL